MTEHAQPKTMRTKSRLVKLGALIGGLALVTGVALIALLVLKSRPAKQPGVAL